MIIFSSINELWMILVYKNFFFLWCEDIKDSEYF